MIVVDTAIWVDHLRSSVAALVDLLSDDRVYMHPHVLGELSLSSFQHRERWLERLATLPQAPLVRDGDVRQLITVTGLFGTGIGYVDSHLLASTRLLPGGSLWTRDKRLHAQAERLSVAYQPQDLLRPAHNKLANRSH